MDLPLTLHHLAFCKGRDPPTNFKHLDFFNKHFYFPLEKSFPKLFSKIRQSKINSRSVAGPMGQMNRRPSI